MSGTSPGTNKLSSTGKPSAEEKPWAIELSTLSLAQLNGIKKQLDDELDHLSTSFSKLRAAQAKFRECLKTIADGVENVEEDKPILVPLTTSLYVPGKIADRKKVIVDVGTGYFVEKTTKDAKDFYSRKAEELGGNLKDLEKILQNKTGQVRTIEEVIRQKFLAMGTAAGAGGAAAGGGGAGGGEGS